MKRETKIGLLIGLAIIILFGVLITEFVSKPTDVAGTDGNQPRITDAGTNHANDHGPIPPPQGQSYYDPQPAQRVTEQGNQVVPAPGQQEQQVQREVVQQQQQQVTPQPRTVTVRTEEGDSVWKLAQKYLGDGNRWQEIRAANSDRVGPNGEISPNITLTIPLDGSRQSATTEQRVQRSSREATPQPSSAARTATVKEGDTLWRIAARELGDGNRYLEIYKLNRDRLANEDDLKIGQTLRLPAR